MLGQVFLISSWEDLLQAPCLITLCRSSAGLQWGGDVDGGGNSLGLGAGVRLMGEAGRVIEEVGWHEGDTGGFDKAYG